MQPTKWVVVKFLSYREPSILENILQISLLFYRPLVSLLKSFLLFNVLYYYQRASSKAIIARLDCRVFIVIISFVSYLCFSVRLLKSKPIRIIFFRICWTNASPCQRRRPTSTSSSLATSTLASRPQPVIWSTSAVVSTSVPSRNSRRKLRR